MKPEMVDATLVKKSLTGVKKKGGKRGTHELILDGENAPLDLSRATNFTTDDEFLRDSSTQLFYVYNPPTQTYEPITIISLGEDEGSGEEYVLPQSDDSVLSQPEIDNNIHTDHEEIVQTCEQTTIASEVIICDNFDSGVVREEVVDNARIKDEPVENFYGI